MAIRKTVNLLPQQFQTDVNKKFLNATLDQLMTPGTLDIVNGFVGRRDVKNYKSTDSYIVESNTDRRNYQLEPAITIKKDPAVGNIEQSAYKFAATYIDTVNALKSYGGNSYNHDKIFRSEYYAWAPPIDYDKIANYTKYYWLQDGPDVIEINEEINLDSDVIGKTNFTTAGGVKFSSGLKVKFTHVGIDPTTYYNKVYLVANVGKSIELIEWDSLITPESGVYTLGKDYITIKPGSIDGNQWSNNNRWFHEDIITKTAEYNKTTAVYDSNLRAQRPIIEFDHSLKLFNFGYQKLLDVDIVDTYYTDAFSVLEGTPSDGTYINGALVQDGQKIVFTKDTDPFVNGFVFDIQIVTISGVNTIHLEKSLTVAEPKAGNTLIAKLGANAGTQWYYTNSAWTKGQVKTGLNQAPLFDLFDSSGDSFSTYTNSTFAGSKIFSYAVNSAGVSDTELGFAITYKNFNNIGDIVFHDNIIRDSFTYTSDVLNNTSTSIRLATGYMHTSTGLTTYTLSNNWTKALTESRQFIQQQSIVGSELRSFRLTTTPKAETNVKNLIVHVNGSLQEKGANASTTKDYYVTSDSDGQVVNFTRDLSAGDNVIIKVYTDDSIEKLVNGEVYTTPINLSNNPLNGLSATSDFSLGQIREHINSCVENSLEFEGENPGLNNIRDISNIAGIGTNIVQHTASLAKAGYILTNKQHDFFSSIDYAENQYTRFKNLFLSTADKLDYNSNTSAFVDSILRTMFAGKNNTMAFAYSDMVPFSTDNTVISYTVFDPDNKRFELNRTYNDTTPSQISTLVYLNDVMLLKDVDYTFDITAPFVNISNTVTLAANDVLKFVEYNTTQGNFIPPTPTKLGLYPKYIPQKFRDDTYVTPIDVIQGHDGSITPAYGDYKDDVLLELEKRIYNNIKCVYDANLIKFTDIFQGHTRKPSWKRDEINLILSEFLSRWANRYGFDYLGNTTYDVNDPFTWNYGRVINKLNTNEFVPGYWRGIYKYFYDTDRPHSHPWEMLGFVQKPSWWEFKYGPAPYTKDNLVLWQDLEDGVIADGDRAGTYPEYKRTGLVAKYIPTDGSGALLSPRDVGVLSIIDSDRAAEWKVGDDAPVETAWKRSSSYPFAIQKLFALTQTANYFELNYNISQLAKNALGQIVDRYTGLSTTPNTVKVDTYQNPNGVIDRTCGYVNWIVNYLVYLNSSIGDFHSNLNSLDLNLAYKLAGFSDKSKLKILLEQISPTRNSDDIYIPQEDYSFYLLEGTPTDKVVYSGIMIERTDTGYLVEGYSIENPYFNVLPSIITGQKTLVSAGGIPKDVIDYEIGRQYALGQVLEVYGESGYFVVNKEFTASPDFQTDRSYLTRVNDIPTDGGVSVYRYEEFNINPVKVPYQHEFKTIQDTYDFIISYGRYLESIGLVFDNVTSGFGNVEDWNVSGQEFLFWTLTNFGPGSKVTLSAGSNKLKFNLDTGQVGSLVSAVIPSAVLDQNKKRILISDLFYNRIDNEFELQCNPDVDGIYGVILNPVQTEHLLILENQTVFNDIIWDLSTGNRQNRIKLVGYKTRLWDGTRQLPGYVLLDDSVDDWDVNNVYELGEIVRFKSKFYTCNIKHSPSDLTELGKFDFSKWRLLDKVETGLLPNLDSKADQFRGFYEIEEDARKIETEQLASNLIGFQSRKYLENLQISETAQKKFYQGFIKEKGTTAVVDKLLRVRREELTPAINLYEEWAFRVGEYGSVDSSQIVDFYLRENEFKNSPDMIEVINSNEQYKSTHITQKPQDLYAKPSEPFYFDKNFFASTSSLITDRSFLPTAGYVRTDDAEHLVLELSDWVSSTTIFIPDALNVDTAIVGKTNYVTSAGINLVNGSVIAFANTNIVPASYYAQEWVVSGVGTAIKLTEKRKYLNSLAIGDKVWVANADSYPPKFKEDTKDWNVYRITNTGNAPLSISKDADNEITVTFRSPVSGVLVGEYIILRRFYNLSKPIEDYSGIFKVKKNLTSSGIPALILQADTLSENLYAVLPDSQSPVVTSGEFIALKSARWLNETNLINTEQPRYGWEDGDIAWVDDYQDTGRWAVLEKKNPYKLGKQIYPNSKSANTGFGQSVALNSDTSVMLVGSVYDDTSIGSIEQWTRDVKTVFDVTKIFVSGYGSVTTGLLSTSGYLLTVSTDGLPQPAPFGTFPTEKNPHRVVSRAIEHTFRIRVGENTSSSNPVELGLGGIGIAANGVAFASPLINGNLPFDSGPAKGVPPTGFNWNAVAGRLNVGFDNSDGHPQEDNHYHYHSGRFLSQWNDAVYTANEYYNDTNYSGDHWRHTDGHSKIIGYAYDGYPIYGPFGYQDPANSKSTVTRMTSSYVTRALELAGRDYTYLQYPAGTFIQDYFYSDGAGTLDKFNGRYTVTPDYPDGTYAYFLTLKADGTPVYPYIIGPTFKEKPVLETDKKPSDPAGTNTQTVLIAPSDFAYLNSLLDGTQIYNTKQLGWRTVISPEGEYAVTSAPGSNSSEGYVFVLKQQEDKSYKAFDVLRAPAPLASGYFGYDVDISNNGGFIIVGEPGALKSHIYKLSTGIAEGEEYISGTGSTTTFATLIDYSAIPLQVTVYVDGQIKVPDLEYTLGANSITFINGVTPSFGTNNIEIVRGNYYYLSQTLTGTSATDFGRSVAISDHGYYAYVGMPNKLNGTNLQAGALAIYAKAPDNTWSEIQEVVSNQINEIEYFGRQVDAGGKGHIIAAGAPGADYLYIFLTAAMANNTGEVETFINEPQLTGTITGTVANPTVSIGDQIVINDIEVTFTGTSLSDVVDDINNKSIPFTTAESTSDNKLKITSTRSEKNNKLSITIGTVNGTTVFTDLGIVLYNYKSTLVHPDGLQNAYYGDHIKFNADGSKLLISAPASNSIVQLQLDDSSTTIDQKNTTIADKQLESGSALLYDVNDDLSVSLVQRLDWNERRKYDKYGTGTALVKSTAFLGAPGDDYFETQTFTGDGATTTFALTGQYADANLEVWLAGKKQLSGWSSDNATPNSTITFSTAPLAVEIKVYKFTSNTGSVLEAVNNGSTKSWFLKRQQETSRVDINSINKVFTYNQKTNKFIEYVDVIDPVKGKISGAADQEINFKSYYDPAIYNQTSDLESVNEKDHWGPNEVGTLWWDLTNTKYIDYEQGDLEYRKNTWGKLFPGTEINIYEWIESDVLPSEYIQFEGDGIPKASDDSAYVKYERFDSPTGTLKPVYYYWVKDKKSVPQVSNAYLDANGQIKFSSRGKALELQGFIPAATRKLPAASVADLIQYPEASGIKYIGAIAKNAIIGYNLNKNLVNNDIVLSINYDTVKNDIPLHTEWQLVQKNNKLSKPNKYLVTKLSDSLVGQDSKERPVPDLTVQVGQRYGILNYPRQTMFINKFDAIKILVDYCNGVFATNKMAIEYVLTKLNTADPLPKFGYNETVETYTELTYINTNTIGDGYNVVVKKDETQGNYWTTYSWNVSDSAWVLGKKQKYDTTKYWDYADWYDVGYSSLTIINQTVATKNDLLKITANTGNIVKVLNDGQNKWTLYEKAASSYKIVGQENATIKLKTDLYTVTTPLEEIRHIIDALQNELFIGNLEEHFNKVWFELVQYALVDQNQQVDWAFKTSFVGATQTVRNLTEVVNYSYDIQESIKSYVDEAKPYRTNLREYIFRYPYMDTSYNAVTDFDLPGYWDETQQIFRSPNVYEADDDAKMQEGPWINWFNHYTNGVDRIEVIDGGSGYGDSDIDEYAEGAFDTTKYDGELVTYSPPVIFIESGAQWELGYSYTADVRPGEADAQAVLVVPDHSPDTLWYYSSDIKDMGWKVRIQDHPTSGTTESVTFAVTVVIDGEGNPDFYIDGAERPNLILYRGSTYTFTQTDASNANKGYFRFSALEDGTHRDGSGATAVPVMTTPGLDSVASITVTNPGTGYVTTPKVIIQGGSGSGVKAYAQLENYKVRDILETIKFDRVDGPRHVKTIAVDNGGSGYTSAPTVTITGVVDSLTLTDKGLGYTVAPNIVISPPEDLSGTQATASLTLDADGSISTVTLTNAGSGYINPPYVQFVKASPGDPNPTRRATATATNTGQGGSGAQAVATISGGSVQSITVTEQGKDYLTAPTVIISGGGGANATATATISFTNYNRLESAHEATTKKHSDRLTLYYSGGQTGTNSDKNWKNEQADIPTYEAVISDSGVEYKANKVWGAPFSLEPGYDRASYARNAFDDYAVTDEGIRVIASVDTDLTGGDFSTTGGIDPANVVVDGDGFVTPYTSHAPEEQIPGRVFDTLDLQVYELASPRDSGVTVKKYSYYGNGSTTAYDFTDLGGLPTASFGAEVYIDNVLQIRGTDFSLNFADNTVELTSPATKGQLVHIVLIETGGENISAFKQDFTGDGSTTEFIVNIPYQYAQSLYITVDGIDAAFTATSYYKKTKITFSVAPANFSRVRVNAFNLSGLTLTNQGSKYDYTSPPAVTFSGGGGSNAAATAVVHPSGHIEGFIITNFGTGYTSAPTVTIGAPASGGVQATATATIYSDKIGIPQPYIRVDSEEFTLSIPGVPTWPADYTVTYPGFFEERGPDGAKAYAYLNGTRLTPPDTEYYTGDGSTTAFASPTNPTVNYALATDADMQVHVNGVLQQLTFDYTFTGAPDARSEVTFVTAPVDGAEVAITVRNGEYWIENDQNIILENGSGLASNAGAVNGDKLFVQSFANQKYSQGKTITIEGSSIATSTALERFDQFIYDTTGYSGDVSVAIATPVYDIRLLQEEYNTNYAWVWLNGVYQIANHDYFITDDGYLVMTPRTGAILASDKITVSTKRGAEAEQGQGLAFRIWKNMFDDVAYYRIASKNITTLLYDLLPTDTYIQVEDASKLMEPDTTNGIPGVIFIAGERIEYWEKVGGRLNRIRRGTWGTGFASNNTDAGASRILAGTKIVDAGKQQVMPGGADAHNKVWYDQGSSTATNGKGLGSANTLQAKFLKEGPFTELKDYT